MAARPRKPHEPYRLYRLRLKLDAKKDKKKLTPRVFWYSSTKGTFFHSTEKRKAWEEAYNRRHHSNEC